MTADVVGMMAAFADEHGDRAADLARALTALQVGIEILGSLSSTDPYDIETHALIRSLAVATERVAQHVTALGMIAQRAVAPW